MAPGAAPLALPGDVTRTLIALGLFALASGCGGPREPPPAESELQENRIALGASFVGGHGSGLRRLLHPDLIVQPPEPDTALQGEAAADYLEGLARESRVARSELLPVSLTREGRFLLERGGWHLRSGNGTLASRYTLRWRETPAGWKVVLWRWTLFR
ncbi:MAG TPA: hypothetical protein VH764_02890 [Gemmatimonadales bacterium]